MPRVTIEVGTRDNYSRQVSKAPLLRRRRVMMRGNIGAMTGDPDYRSVTSEVRTPRFAAFVDENNPHWRTAVASLVRIFSETWGGKYFLIVPTDGKRIRDKYWELLESL
jgi:hypothetical protein